jgi:hypothetical protein
MRAAAAEALVLVMALDFATIQYLKFVVLQTMQCARRAGLTAAGCVCVQQG